MRLDTSPANKVETCRWKYYFVTEDAPNVALSMQEAYIQSVALTPSLLQRACEDKLSALTPVMKPRIPWRSHM